MAGKDWYSPGEVRFTIRQVLFLIRNLPELREGYWPVEASNYIDIPIGKRTGSHKAYFVTPIDYAAEIEMRLEKCGIDGLILEAIECWDKSIASIASYLRKPEWSIRKRRKKALGYVASGPDRRWIDTNKRKTENYQEFRRKK